MPVVCWGALAKSANDNTTIPDYIAGKILEHNIDPSAHGLNGYAIYDHRSQTVLDHLDYSITSDKISAYQIIGKHFVTDANVGPSVDGIEFDKNAISMWYGASRKVYIPKTGNPEFKGNVALESLSYLKDLITLTFEGLTAYSYEAGHISTWPGGFSLFAGGSNWVTADLIVKPSVISPLLWEKNPGFSCRSWGWYGVGHLEYFGLGDFKDYGRFNYIGFQVINNILYAANYSQNAGYWKKTALPGYNMNNVHKFQVSTFYNQSAYFFIDDALAAVHNQYLPTDDVNLFSKWRAIIYPFATGNNATRQWQNLMIWQDW